MIREKMALAIHDTVPKHFPRDKEVRPWDDEPPHIREGLLAVADAALDAMWRPISDLGPHDTVHMVNHAAGDMWFAIISGPDHYDWSAVVWNRNPALFFVVEMPSNNVIDAAYAARMKPEARP